MADNSKHHPQRLRTFASDMQAERDEQEHKEGHSSEKPAVTEHEPIPVAAAPTPRKEMVREDVPEPEITEPVIEASEPETETHSQPIVETPKTPIKIPAFHELQKSVAAIQENITAETIRPEKHLRKKNKPAKNSAPHRPNIGYDATVITDTKADRFQLFPSVTASLKEWFKKITAKKPKKIPKYTVPDTERRKGLIQRATSKTGAIFTADSDTLKEQIRRRHLQEEMEKEGEAETIWTPFTETGFSLLDAPDERLPVIQNVKVEYRKQPPIIEPTITPVVVAPAPVIAEEPTKVNQDILAEARWNASHEEIKESPEVVSEPQPKPVVTPLREGKITPSPTAQEKEEVTIQRTGFLSSFDTNTLTVLLLVTIIGIVAIVFITRIVITKINEEPIETFSVEVLSEPLLTSAKLVGIPLTAKTLDQLPELVRKATASSSMGLIEYAVVSAVGDEVSAPYLFDILHFRTTPNFRQSLTAAHFASINHSTPAIVLHFVDTDTVRGGLLNWETSMPEDLTPLYDLPSGVTPDFTDETVSGVDVRVLRSNEEVVLVYGIVKKNTAVITTNTADFAQIVELGLLR